MFDRFTDRARKVMALARKEALRFNHDFIGTEHILLGLIQEGSGVAANVLKNLAVEIEKVRREVEKNVESGPSVVTMGQLPFTPRAKKVLEFSMEEAHELGHNYIGTEHLLLGLIRENDGNAAQVLLDFGLKLEDVREAVLELLGAESMQSDRPISQPSPPRRGRSKASGLDTFGRDLTKRAREERLGPFCGREKELEQVLLIVGRRLRRNPLLVGEPGVGKTALVEGLVRRLLDPRGLPAFLAERRVVQVDFAPMVAGCKYRGDFEERLLKTCAEIRDAGDVLLVVEDVDALVGVGETSGGLDAASILKPLIARGDVQCIGTIREDRVDAFLDSHSLAALFEAVWLDSMDIAATREVLGAHKDATETHHGVRVLDRAMDVAVELSGLYLPRGVQPEKALSVLDQACSSLASTYPAELSELEAAIEKLNQQKKAAVASEEFESAAAFRGQAAELQEKKDQLERRWREGGDGSPTTVDRDAVEEVIAKWVDVSPEDVRARRGYPVGDRDGQAQLVLEFERLQLSSALPGDGVSLLPGTALVVAPNDETGARIFDGAIAPALESHGLEVTRVPAGELRELWNGLRSAQVIVADTTGCAPHVVYALGLAHALRRSPVLLAQDPTDLPVHLRCVSALLYQDTAEAIAVLRARLELAVGKVLGWSRQSED